MTEDAPTEQATLFPKTAGERLREARAAQGLSLAEIAARTRIPARQLEAIEEGNYASLPSITYSVGFAKAYARAVGLDEVAIARDVRGASGASDQPAARRTDYEAYEIDEPARVPTRGVAIGALIVALLLLVGVGVYYGTNLFRGDDEVSPVPTAVVQNTVPEAPAVAPTPAAPAGPVVLTATDEVWLRVYDKANTTLKLGTLKAGEAYAVPADAVGPMINVGRPDKLQVTVGGAAVAPLGDGKRAIKDVPIDAAALAARGTAAPLASATPVASATPAATATGSTSHAKHVVQQHVRSTPTTSAPLNIAAPMPVAPEPAPAATAAP